MCSYCSSCLDLPVAFVDCHIKGCKSRLHHVCQGGYVDMHEIDLDGAERKICHNCVDDLWMGGKPEKLKMVQHMVQHINDSIRVTDGITSPESLQVSPNGVPSTNDIFVEKKKMGKEADLLFTVPVGMPFGGLG